MTSHIHGQTLNAGCILPKKFEGTFSVQPKSLLIILNINIIEYFSPSPDTVFGDMSLQCLLKGIHFI